MRRGPASGKTTVDHVARATDAWGSPPDWVLALAEACVKATQKAVGEQIGYSPATISQILSNTYRGDLVQLEILVRGALMGETVHCPILGALTRDVCAAWQAKPWAPTSSHRIRMFQACRNGCPNSRVSNNEVKNAV